MYGHRKASSPVAAAALALAGWVLGAPASAQPAPPSVGVVRATDGDALQALADAVDAALLRDLSAVAGIDSPVVSPIDYSEIELGVGCSDASRACLLSIARAVRVDALIVRRLSAAAEGLARLELTYFEGASTDAPVIVEATATADQMHSVLVAAVPSLVRRLFGIAEVAEPAAPPAAPDRPVTSTAPQTRPAEDRALAPERKPGVSAATWIALGVGAAALTTGIVLGWTAQEDFDHWKDAPVRSRREADDARAQFDDIQGRAIAADVLLAAGAVGVGLGITLLVLELSSDTEAAAGHARLAVSPAIGGGTLRLEGALRGAF